MATGRVNRCRCRKYSDFCRFRAPLFDIQAPAGTFRLHHQLDCAMSKGVQIAGGATLIALILGWYAATNLDGGIAYAYYETLTDFQSSPDAQQGRESRVHGYVALQSIERDVAGKVIHFTVVNDPPHAGGGSGGSMPVVFQSLETPDMFKDGAEVVIEGRMLRRASGVVFEADKLYAKCPSKFEAKAAETASF
jgi:cytochrome c-type biogenesis protein CcmE